MKDTLNSPDSWSLKPTLVALLTVAVLSILSGLPGSLSFVLIPLSLVGYVLSAFIILAVSAYCFAKRRPRRASSILLMLLLPVLLWRSINLASDYVHLGLTAGLGVGQLGRTSASADGAFVAYDWSVGLAGGPNTFLIHDLSDEVALPLAQHSRRPDAFSVEEGCAANVKRLLGHYYVCSF